MEIELLDEPTTALTVTARAALARIAAEAKAVEPQPAKPAPVEAIAVTEIFNQEDGSDLLDGPCSPSDAEVIRCAAAAVAQRFGWNFNDALNRLAEVDEWKPLEIDDRLLQRRARREALPDPLMGEPQAL